MTVLYPNAANDMLMVAFNKQKNHCLDMISLLSVQGSSYGTEMPHCLGFLKYVKSLWRQGGAVMQLAPVECHAFHSSPMDIGTIELKVS
ncbi:hypothetical protein V5799_013996 [Amblyomma americanum]|uniref:Uncharacterized protein n=1 Tax=Amblyomma americanum TaxID=6943 RepID=A0AAQ4E4A9_AMBAM